ncbi:hypothetical protein ARMGADRAFT_1038933 [Armillaria gallica]|uniref:Uncharacterized protein n=1 Tax=Armillaria gallica TaxID=47427 RepID=A0A2H3CJJ0_ARMGA|nr:hypothetical protein ARMGADRAFT_1038933 [Armillaria gallica]
MTLDFSLKFLTKMVMVNMYKLMDCKATQPTVTATKKTTTKATKAWEAPVKKSLEVQLKRPTPKSPVSGSNPTPMMSTEASAEVSPPIHPPMLLPPGEGLLPSPPTESRPSSPPSAPPSPPPALPCPPPPLSLPPPLPPYSPMGSLYQPSPPLSPAVFRANSPQSSRIASRLATPDDTLDVMEFVTPEDGEDGTVMASKQGKHLKENNGRKESSGHARGSNKDTGESLSTAKDKKQVVECGDDDASGPDTSGRAKRRKVSKEKDTAATPSNTERPPQLDLPKDAPKWAVNAIKLFKWEDVPQWLLQLVKTWINFETHKKNWKHTGKLSAMDRPKPVDRFHLQAVKSSVDPVKDFESKFWLWWSQLQPEFQQHDESDIALALDNEGRPDTTSEGNWEML